MYQQESFGEAFKRGYKMIPKGLRYIITANVIIYLLMTIGGSTVRGLFINWFGFYADPFVAFTQPWRLFTYMFLHANLFHILFNMLWVWWLGKMVEDQLGTKNFLTIYLGAGIGGALINVVVVSIFGGGEIPTVGASGSVFGIMVVFAMLFPTFKLMLLLLPPIEARFLVAGLILIDLLFISASDGIARIVHLGGAFWGFALLKMYYRGYNYDAWLTAIGNAFSRKRQKTYTSKNKKMHSVEDAQIVEEEEQSELDRILDKISKKGYEGLTADEKRKLFDLSNKN